MACKAIGNADTFFTESQVSVQLVLLLMFSAKKGYYRRRSRGTEPTVTPTRTITPTGTSTPTATATATHTPPTPVTNPSGGCLFVVPWRMGYGVWSMEYGVFGIKNHLLFDFRKKNHKSLKLFTLCISCPGFFN